MAEHGGLRSAQVVRPNLSHRKQLRDAFGKVLDVETFEQITRKVVDLAKAGDKDMIKLCFEHGLGRPSAAGSADEMVGAGEGATGASARQIARQGEKVVGFPGSGYSAGDEAGATG